MRIPLLRPRALARALLALARALLALTALAVSACSRGDLREACEAIAPGDAFAAARARLDATGAHYDPPSAHAPHVWSKTSVLLHQCFVWEDGHGRVARRTFSRALFV